MMHEFLHMFSTLNYVTESMCVFIMLFCSSLPFPPPVLCSVDCHGDEDKLKDCTYHMQYSPPCRCSDIVGISCSKFNLLTKTCNHVISQLTP